jgi:hypothetical protein
VAEKISPALQVLDAVHFPACVAQVELVERRRLRLPGRRVRPSDAPDMGPGKHGTDDEDDADNQRNDNRQPKEVVSPEGTGLGVEEAMHSPKITGQPFEGMTTICVQRTIG